MDKRVVIWGVGRRLESMYRMIDWDEIVCLVDSNPNKFGKVVYEREIVEPNKLLGIKFDFIIIFVSKPYDEIYSYLVNNLQIEKSKIRYWSQYYNYYSIMEAVKFLFQDIKNGNILDIRSSLEKERVYSFDILNENIKIYGCNKNKNFYPIYKNLYREVYDDYQEAVLVNKYKAVFLGNINQFANIESFEALVKRLLNNVDKIYFTRPYPDELQNCYWSKVLDLKIGNIKEWNLSYEKLLCIEKNKQKKEVVVYIAAHKEFLVPQIENYEPLWLGDSKLNIYGFQEDKEEPSISYLNPLINECTGLYWMWKHSKSEYIGLVHYRRYFLNDDSNFSIENVLKPDNIKDILSDYDIILPELVQFPYSLYKHLRGSIDNEAFEQGYKIIKELIENKHTDYKEAFDYVFKGNAMYPCNMFITSRNILNRYCEWLFSIIIDAANSINVDDYSAYSKRVIGFFAERLFTVWLVKQSLKIKQLPIFITESIVNINTDVLK